MSAMQYSDLLLLKRWNTPTIYNGWEAITRNDRTKGFFNREETRDFMPEMGPMVGYAITVVIEPSNPAHQKANAEAASRYREYVASIDGPKIVVVQDLDKPEAVGAFWGEVNSSAHMALGCVGTICDGAIRDLDEMKNAGFKALARRLCVGHAFSTPVRWNCEIEVFGVTVRPGNLIHADKHGFIIIPEEDQDRIVEAAAFMDANECRTIIPAARSTAGMTKTEIKSALNKAEAQFRLNTKEKFGNKGK